MRKFHLLPVAVFMVACARDPVNPPAAHHETSTARYDGGGMVGSGNFVPIDATKTSTDPAQMSAEAAGNSVSRGGGMVGSGN